MMRRFSGTPSSTGCLLTLSSSVASSSYGYDSANQLLSESITIRGLTGAKTVANSYDADGNRASLTGPGGQVVTYSYTGRNQVASVVADGPPPLATFTYDAAGNRITKALENGITSTYNYDGAGRLTSLVHGTGVETLSYTYDTMDRRTSETRTSGGLRSFGYDASGQLIQVSHSGGNATFAYDAVGNRTTVSGAAGAGSYSENALNQYTTAGGVGSLTYDTNGNLATGGGWTFTHNGDSRLIAVTGTATATFGRDARNREVVRTINGTTTYLIYDGWTTGAGGGSGEIPRLRDPRIRGGEMSRSERVNFSSVFKPAFLCALATLREDCFPIPGASQVGRLRRAVPTDKESKDCQLNATLDDSRGDRVAGQSGGIMDIQLGHQACTVFFDGLAADPENIGALFVSLALSDQLEDLPLPRSQGRGGMP